MNQYNLGGHSGCKIYLIEKDDGSVFVRKISKDLSYNQRMKTQCDKQMNYKSQDIKAPKVFHTGYTKDDLFYFDMEYVQGVTLAEYIKTMEIGKVRGLVETLIKNIIPKKNEIGIDSKSQDINNIFEKKFVDLRDKLSSHNNPIIDESLDLLAKHDWSAMIPSMCHGDMTLENIIVKDDKLYFIDFLDSFYDSWLLDIGTLLQDVQVMWSYRFNDKVSMNTVLRLIVFRDVLLDVIKNVDTHYVKEAYYALLQKLIRIYPYTKDKHTYQFLNEKTKIILETISNLEKEVD